MKRPRTSTLLWTPVVIAGIALVYWGFYSPASSDRVHLAVSSSLGPVVTELSNRLGPELPGRPVVSTAGSQTVARRIAHGQSADVVFLANRRWMDYLDERGLLEPDSRRNLLRNHLVLVGAPGAAKIPSLRALSRQPVRLALGNVESVPAGIYARRTFESLGLWENASFTPVQFPHVRAVLSAVESGGIPYGVVYRTDRRRDGTARVLLSFPAEHTPDILYPVALVKDPSKRDRRWFQALLGRRARGVYREFGFEVLAE